MTPLTRVTRPWLLAMALSSAPLQIAHAQTPRPLTSPYAAFVGQRVEVEDVVAQIGTTPSGIPVLVLGAARPNERVLVYLRPRTGRIDPSWMTALRAGEMVSVRGLVSRVEGSYAITVLDASDLRLGTQSMARVGQPLIPPQPPMAYGAYPNSPPPMNYGAYPGPPPMAGYEIPGEPGRHLPGAKDPGLGLLFSFLLTGGGQIYAGEVKRGLTMLLVPAGVAVASFGVAAATCDDTSYDPWRGGSNDCDSAALAAAGVTGVVALGSWIYSMVDAGSAVKRYNASLAQRNMRPYVGQGPSGTARVGVSVGF